MEEMSDGASGMEDDGLTSTSGIASYLWRVLVFWMFFIFSFLSVILCGRYLARRLGFGVEESEETGVEEVLDEEAAVVEIPEDCDEKVDGIVAVDTFERSVEDSGGGTAETADILDVDENVGGVFEDVVTGNCEEALEAGVE